MLNQYKEYFLDYVYYPIYRFWSYYIHLRWIKWVYEYIRYGFSSRQLWNFDRTCTDFILPRLKAFRRGMGNSHSDGPSGCPMLDGYLYEQSEEEFDKMHQEWTRILDVMIEGFTYHQLDEDDLDLGGFYIDTTDSKNTNRINMKCLDEEKYEAYKVEMLRRDKVIEEALAYFAKYYRNIWD